MLEALLVGEAARAARPLRSFLADAEVALLAAACPIFARPVAELRAWLADMDPYAREIAVAQLARAGVKLGQLAKASVQDRMDLGNVLFDLYPKRKVDVRTWENGAHLAPLKTRLPPREVLIQKIRDLQEASRQSAAHPPALIFADVLVPAPGKWKGPKPAAGPWNEMNEIVRKSGKNNE